MRLILPFFATVVALFASNQVSAKCTDDGKPIRRRVGDFTLTVSPTKLTEPNACRATITSSSGHTIFRGYDYRIEIQPASGNDLNEDGSPDAVFQGFSGGAHCCWTYWIVSLGEPAGLLRTIYNLRDGKFLDLNKDGRFEFVTFDGSFDYFDDMSHAFSPFPTVILRFEGNKLRRVNNEFWPRYSREIREVQKQLSKQSLSLFRSDDRDAMHRAGLDWLKTRQRVLEIVLAYLYGGRENEAWAALREMWPPSDVRRIRRLIIKTSVEGFLADPNNPKYGRIE